ncbi:MAG: hypothetical protein K5870_08885, partial [Lachnospiraceae bacterium]|nr:hypothetical protein [Lachnospiraceae bacterium]
DIKVHIAAYDYLAFTVPFVSAMAQDTRHSIRRTLRNAVNLFIKIPPCKKMFSTNKVHIFAEIASFLNNPG